ncbi:MAG: T9SS type A sorting domain-containing protein, partial [Flavobacteriales bacterium]|nr:T9SS type A sorting domain-containing protein [Flavobacteriales bacterium]
GKYTWFSAGTYHDTLSTGAVGCDSILTIHLTIAHGSHTTTWPRVCGAYTSPSGKYIWTTSGTYRDTVSSSQGCDSLVTFYLTVYSTSYQLDTAIACDGYTWNVSGLTYTNSGIYSDSLKTSQGCDSVRTLELTLNYSDSSAFSARTCNSYNAPSGKHSWTSSGQYRDTVATNKGCDSIIKINLTIDKLDLLVDNTGGVLRSKQAGANYQWLNCSAAFAEIQGATQQTFKPAVNGYYAAEIALNTCKDTTQCVEATGVGLTEHPLSKHIRIYPNPTSGEVTLEWDEEMMGAHLVIENTLGQQLEVRTLITGFSTEIKLSGPSGVYYIKLRTKQGVTLYYKLIKV